MMYGHDERENRRHAWSAVDTREAVCTRCDARTRVSLVVTEAGVRAAIARHGPERCPGRKSWWKRSYWDTWTKEPALPWANDDKPAKIREPVSDRSGSPRARPDRSDSAARTLVDVLDPHQGADEIAASSNVADRTDRVEASTVADRTDASGAARQADRTDTAAGVDGGPDRHEHQADDGGPDRHEHQADEGALCGDCGWPSSSKPSKGARR